MRVYIIPAILTSLLIAASAYAIRMHHRFERNRSQAELVDRYCMELASTYRSLGEELRRSPPTKRAVKVGEIYDVLATRYASDVIMRCVPRPHASFGECYLREDYDCIVAMLRAKGAEVVSRLGWPPDQ